MSQHMMPNERAPTAKQIHGRRLKEFSDTAQSFTTARRVSPCCIRCRRRRRGGMAGFCTDACKIGQQRILSPGAQYFCFISYCLNTVDTTQVGTNDRKMSCDLFEELDEDSLIVLGYSFCEQARVAPSTSP